MSASYVSAPYVSNAIASCVSAPYVSSVNVPYMSVLVVLV